MFDTLISHTDFHKDFGLMIPEELNETSTIAILLLVHIVLDLIRLTFGYSYSLYFCNG